ncbi:PIN domain-containing protein [uncultured Methanobrevibacter sp.]|uniref:type II toxin-antitoxin system VapC family toxin n=1 Tax=uncultured Methanobrevibacter sp. TaxID=253161 RepID=UPI0026223020
MESREVFIDTNFFMIPFQFNVDILEEFKRILPNYRLVTCDFVIRELQGLKKNSKGKVRLAAGLGLKIAQSDEIEVKQIPLNNGESVDDALLRISKVLATNDIDLKRRAKRKGITLIYLRQKKYLAVEGYLP